MLAAVATITLGTLYPIILDAMDWEKISVGEPYFNTVFLPIILPILFLMGVAPHVHWGEERFASVWKRLRLNFFLCLLIGAIGPYLFGFPFRWLASVGVFFSVWIVLATLQYVFSQKKMSIRNYAMVVAHIGIAVLTLGVTMTKSYSEERQMKISPNDTVMLAGYAFTLQSIIETHGPNYKSATATFSVAKNHSTPQILIAQQRIYTSHDQSLSKPGILTNGFRDLYLALGAPLNNNAWSVRIYYKPLVRWIWAGGFLLMAGGLLTLVQSRKKTGVTR
jgi:cytochrome c-type biogenesis protein CcmF